MRDNELDADASGTKGSRHYACGIRSCGGGLPPRYRRSRREPEHRGTAGRHRGHAALRHPRPRMWTGQGPPCLLRTRARGHGPGRVRGVVALARAASGRPVLHQDFLDLDLPPARFDGIFANAVLFHVPSSQIGRVLADLAAALNPAACSFLPIRAAGTRKVGSVAAMAVSMILKPGVPSPPERVSSSCTTTTGRPAVRAPSSPGSQRSGAGVKAEQGRGFPSSWQLFSERTAVADIPDSER